MRPVILFALMTLGADSALGQDQKNPPVLRSARSGPWSATTTWEAGRVPAAGDKVLIREGHRVVYDVVSDRVVRGITVAGEFAFAPDQDTRLDVGLIVVRPGDEYTESGFDCDGHPAVPDPSKPGPALEVGTPDRPIDPSRTAVIRLHYIPGMDKDSCPAIVCCGGRMDLHGTPLSRTWVKLGTTAKAGDSSVMLAEPVTGWKVGDRVFLTGTQRHGAAKTASHAEERIVRSVAGAALTLDRPLDQTHAGDGDYRGEVADLSRNVVIESADPDGVRGHTMYHRDSAGSVSYAEFRHLGKKGVLGRYALHYHLCGATMRGSSVVGTSIWDSHNRWLTVHGTNYLVVRDNVGYQSVGHGFFLEDGTEVFNVFDRNLAVAATPGKKLPKQILPFDQNEGAGFWWANSLNTFTRNVAAECGRYGFRYEATPSSAGKLTLPVEQPDGTSKPVDIRTLPFVRFDDNEVHSSVGLYGVNLGEGVNRVGPDPRHPFVVRNLKVWDVHYALRPQVPNLLVENLTIHRAAYGVYHPNFDNHAYRNVLISQTNTEPFNRGHDDDSIQYGVLTVDGLTFDGCRSGGMPLVQISDDNPTGRGETHLRNVKTLNWSDSSKVKAIVNLGGGPRPQPKTEVGVPVYLHDWYGPGRHAVVVSIRSGEYKRDPEKYRKDAPLTGDESRVAEVSRVAFPNRLDPLDDLPPTTVITSVRPSADLITVRGTTADNGPVRRVLVNGNEARAVASNFAEWEVVLTRAADGPVQLKAFAEDAAGNVERTPMIVRRK